MDKQTVVYLHNKMLFPNKKEPVTESPDNMDGF